MILLLLLLIPFASGLFILFVKNNLLSRITALLAAGLNLSLTFILIFNGQDASFALTQVNYIGIDFELGVDATSLLMLLLTNLLFPVIIASGINCRQEKVPLLHALILFSQSALIGVFLAQNAILFYVFWELTLLPIYFMLLLWGDENRRAVTLKFFIYTVLGSLFLLFGIIYLYNISPDPHTTDFHVLSQLEIPSHVQVWLFWILFIAFAIKMPLFPFHSWQPGTYAMAPTQGVMILAGVMTKMGIYGALKFIFPIVPLGVEFWKDTIIILSLIGMVYASIIAYRQVNLKRLVAFSSMAHISLLVTALFAVNQFALQGALIQVVSHGIVIVALFYLTMLIQEKTGTLSIDSMGGVKHIAPKLSVFMLIVVLGSISLPLTAGFVGEFLILIGLFKSSIWIAAIAGLSMILGAIYMLYAYQRVMLGEVKTYIGTIVDMKTVDYFILIPLLVLLIGLGVYPQPIIELTNGSIEILQHYVLSTCEVVKNVIY